MDFITVLIHQCKVKNHIPESGSSVQCAPGVKVVKDLCTLCSIFCGRNDVFYNESIVKNSLEASLPLFLSLPTARGRIQTKALEKTQCPPSCFLLL